MMNSTQGITSKKCDMHSVINNGEPNDLRLTAYFKESNAV